MDNAIDKLLDENSTENIVLYDVDNKPTEFEQIAVIPLNKKIYALLHPVEETVGIKRDEALVFEIDEIEGEDVLKLIADEEVIFKVFQIYYDMLLEQYNDEDE